MKNILLVSLMFFSANLMALPCFQVGNYEGMGMFKDNQQKSGSYKVKLNVADSDHATQVYSIPTGDITLEYKLSTDQIFVNNSKVSSGKISCGLASLRLTTEYKEQNESVKISEEWTTLGNYLLRSGIKVMGPTTIKYQELLVRQ